MPANLEKLQQCAQDWKRSVFIPIPKKGNVKECSNYHTIALISRASKDFPGGSDGKVSAYKAGDPASIPGLGRSPGSRWATGGPAGRKLRAQGRLELHSIYYFLGSSS